MKDDTPEGLSVIGLHPDSLAGAEVLHDLDTGDAGRDPGGNTLIVAVDQLQRTPPGWNTTSNPIAWICALTGSVLSMAIWSPPVSSTMMFPSPSPRTNPL